MRAKMKRSKIDATTLTRCTLGLFHIFGQTLCRVSQLRVSVCSISQHLPAVEALPFVAVQHVAVQLVSAQYTSRIHSKRYILRKHFLSVHFQSNHDKRPHQLTNRANCAFLNSYLASSQGFGTITLHTMALEGNKIAFESAMMNKGMSQLHDTMKMRLFGRGKLLQGRSSLNSNTFKLRPQRTQLKVPQPRDN